MHIVLVEFVFKFNNTAIFRLLYFTYFSVLTLQALNTNSTRRMCSCVNMQIHASSDLS